MLHDPQIMKPKHDAEATGRDALAALSKLTQDSAQRASAVQTECAAFAARRFNQDLAVARAWAGCGDVETASRIAQRFCAETTADYLSFTHTMMRAIFDRRLTG